MSQGQVQIQKTEQKQVQTVSQQQLLQAMLTELPVNQLIDRINTEMDDNPALEVSADDNVDDIDNSLYDTSDDAVEPSGDNNADDYEARTEKEDRQTALDDALISIGRDDEDLPVYQGSQRDVDYGTTQSFHDQLIEQMNETELSPLQAKVMEYLIGSLDDDGLLRKSADDIADELAIYNNIYVSEEEIETVVKILQQFDPPRCGSALAARVPAHSDTSSRHHTPHPSHGGGGGRLLRRFHQEPLGAHKVVVTDDQGRDRRGECRAPAPESQARGFDERHCGA